MPTPRWLVVALFLCLALPAWADGFGPAAALMVVLAPLALAGAIFGLCHLVSGRHRSLGFSAFATVLGLLVAWMLVYVQMTPDDNPNPLSALIWLLFKPEYLALGAIIAVGMGLGRAALIRFRS